MKRARIVHAGREQWAVVDEASSSLELAHGEVVSSEAVTWLPPVTPGATLFCLGLNYADHNKELGFGAQAEPLIFLKGHQTLVGQGGSSPRPADANQMHPECELVAVIGRPARRISRENALDYVSGYTIACDYAVREYLENFYRPNLRVKNRDGATPLGPWVVDAADVPDPASLRLETRVDGRIVQSGSTADMVYDVPGLIEHLSAFMTLSPGDLILTGTPHGLHFVKPGETVVCSIEGIGELTHYVVAG